ncbi:MAG TPA: 4a-hydroxytetrahydrobiopterin dehydratase [Acidimicrobiales bacterium]|jgi:4a-hydroxytetrahydrobiopterin dehydratase
MTRPPRLDPGTVDQALAAASSPWERSGDHLELERRFETFGDAIAFVNDVAALAEEADHHPDIEIRYTLVRLSLSTHDAGGLTQLDVDLAAAIAER